MKPRKKRQPKPRERSPIGGESGETAVAPEAHQPRDIEREDVAVEIGPDERGEIDRRDEE